MHWVRSEPASARVIGRGETTSCSAPRRPERPEALVRSGLRAECGTRFRALIRYDGRGSRIRVDSYRAHGARNQRHAIALWTETCTVPCGRVAARWTAVTRYILCSHGMGRHRCSLRTFEPRGGQGYA